MADAPPLLPVVGGAGGGDGDAASASASASAGGAALELIRWDAASGRFEVGQEALAVLRSVRTPVAVAAVCGRARQGKSYLLNRIAGAAAGGGSAVAPTQRPCTKGILLWSRPRRRARAQSEGGPYHLVLLDTEGIDACDQTGQYAVQVLSLAVLLSSLVVYNQLGPIDEAALDRLGVVVEVARRVRVRSEAAKRGGGERGGRKQQGPEEQQQQQQEEDQDEAAAATETDEDDAAEARRARAELARASPVALLWLLRDFYLELRDGDGRRSSPRAYLEAALAAPPAPLQLPHSGSGAGAGGHGHGSGGGHGSGSGGAESARAAVRAAIRELFPNRDCAALVRPVTSEAELAALDALPAARLRPEFREGLARVTEVGMRSILF